MTQLLVDIGNSRVKWARLEAGVLGEQRAAEHAGWSGEDWSAALFADQPAVERVVAASVAGGASLAALDEAAHAATGRGIERITTGRAAAACGASGTTPTTSATSAQSRVTREHPVCRRSVPQGRRVPQ